MGTVVRGTYPTKDDVIMTKSNALRSGKGTSGYQTVWTSVSLLFVEGILANHDGNGNENVAKQKI